MFMQMFEEKNDRKHFFVCVFLFFKEEQQIYEKKIIVLGPYANE